MLVLFETSAGFAIFKLLDERKLREVDNLYLEFQSPERASQIVKLKHFEKFTDTTEALAATTATVEGKVRSTLKKLLQKVVNQDLQDQLLVADAKLGNAIKEKFNVQCLFDNSVQELMRCIRSQVDGLLAGIPKLDRTAMELGLAHGLSCYKLKFSPDKIDTMIVQAVGTLDDLDKELNNYIMRCREWYGWHFPELGKLITDNLAYVKTVKIIGLRENAATADLSDILPEELEQKVKETAELSMGTEIAELDIMNIHILCDQIIELTLCRGQLYDYLRARMMAIAPNLTVLVGELIGARLISQAGSLIALAKHPASTLQILGAEKALFKALKAKRDTPKYGLIYHAQIVGMSSARNKGRISRTLAAKASLAVRYDALGEDSSIALGAAHKIKVEKRLKQLEEGNNHRISGTAKARALHEKYVSKSQVKQYPTSQDSTLPSTKRKFDVAFGATEDKPLIEEIGEGEETTSKKKKKKKKQDGSVEASSNDTGSPSKKKVKQEVPLKVEVQETVLETFESGELKKKKKKKKVIAVVEDPSALGESASGVDSGKKKKKKGHDSSLLELDESFGTSSLFLSPEGSGGKKKKKKNLIEEISVNEQEAQEPASSSDKKKKKKKSFVEEPETTEEVFEPSSEKKKKKKRKMSENE